MCQPTAPWVCCVCLCVYLCMISNQSTHEKPHYVSGLSKPDTLLRKTQIQVLLVLRYQGSTCVDSLLSLSKIAHQMWSDHPFNHRNRTMERTVGRGWRWQGSGGGGQNLKKVRVGNVGGLLKIGVSTPLPLM